MNRMNRLMNALASAACVAWFFFAGCKCTPTQECGTWVFSGTPSGTTFPLTNQFTFDPSVCGKNCQCNQDPMIQMTWVYDAVNHTNIYAAGQPQGTRSDANGWAIDRIGGAGNAYYSLQNDGTFWSGWGLPGSNGNPSTLNDTPGGWSANTYFYALDVAVCRTSDNCQNKILGYYFWSYILDSNDVGQKFITAPAWKELDQEFQDAVAAWNAWAPTSGSQDDGTATLSHAVALPALSDL